MAIRPSCSRRARRSRRSTSLTPSILWRASCANRPIRRRARPRSGPSRGSIRRRRRSCSSAHSSMARPPTVRQRWSRSRGCGRAGSSSSRKSDWRPPRHCRGLCGPPSASSCNREASADDATESFLGGSSFGPCGSSLSPAGSSASDVSMPEGETRFLPAASNDSPAGRRTLRPSADENVSVEERRESPLVPRPVSRLALDLLDRTAKILAAGGISPNAVTAASLALAAVAGVLLARGHFALAGGAMVFASLGDALDGLVARRAGSASVAGALFDASADRYGEFFFLCGLAIYFRGS